MIPSFHSLDRDPCRILTLEVFSPNITVYSIDKGSLTFSVVLRLGLDHLKRPCGEIHSSKVAILRPSEGITNLCLVLCLSDADGILVEVELFGDGDVDGIDVVVRKERGIALLDLEAGLACVLLGSCESQQQGQE